MSDVNATAPAQAPDDFWVTKNKDLMIGRGSASGYGWSDKAKSLNGPHRFLQGTTFLSIVLQVVALISVATTMYIFVAVRNGETLEGPASGLLAMVTILAAQYLPIASYAVLAICVIAYSMFVYRAMKNLHLSDARSVTTSPGWAVGWSFIPIANIGMIYNVMKQIWVGSHDPISGKYDPPITINLWWGSWIGSGIVGRIGTSVAPKDDDVAYLDPSEYLDAFTPTAIITSLSAALSIFSCFCLFRIIKQIVTAQENLRSIAAFDE